VAPAVRKPAASLQRAAVKVKFAADRGDLDDIEAEEIADGVLSYLSETDRASLTSRGDRFHAVPDLIRFKREGSVYLRYAAQQITASELPETTISPELPETTISPAVGQPVTARELPETTITPAVDQPVVKEESPGYDSDELYRDDNLQPVALRAQEVGLTALNTGGPAVSRKRGPNRSWEDHRADQSWESSFEESSSSSSSSSSSARDTDSPPPVTHPPIDNPTPAPNPETPPRVSRTCLQRTRSEGRVRIGEPGRQHTAP
jgi:hypothetical protein